MWPSASPWRVPTLAALAKQRAAFAAGAAALQNFTWPRSASNRVVPHLVAGRKSPANREGACYERPILPRKGRRRAARPAAPPRQALACRCDLAARRRADGRCRLARREPTSLARGELYASRL